MSKLVKKSAFGRRLELQFEVDLAGLLHDDLRLTLDVIDHQARELLRGLKYFRGSDPKVRLLSSRPASHVIGKVEAEFDITETLTIQAN